MTISMEEEISIERKSVEDAPFTDGCEKMGSPWVIRCFVITVI